MDIKNLFIEAAYSTADCPDLYERVTIPNAYEAKKLPRRVTDFNKLSLLPFDEGHCDVITRSNRNRIIHGIDFNGDVIHPERGDVLGFMPEHYAYLPNSAKLNAHNLIVGKIRGFDYRIFAGNHATTIEFPQICFPQDAVTLDLENVVLRKIQELKSGYSRGFEKTGRQYTYYLTAKERYVADEYKIDNRYVAVTKNSPMLGTAVFQVKPIRYAILNFAELPKFINPNGSGNAKALHIASVSALMSADVDDIWEFSRLREYANGDFLKEINHSEKENEFV